MRKARYICRECGKVFEVEIVEADEAREKKIPTRPVICINCKSGNVEPY
jgi:transposase-like protein